MDKKVLDYVIEKTQELIKAPTCSPETKEAAEKWLNAVGSDMEKDETDFFIKELEADIMPIDNLINFAKSDKGIEYFGADESAGIVKHAEKIKAEGAKFCDCPACMAAADILNKKDDMLN